MPDLSNILPSDLMQSILGKLYEIITQGDGTVAPVSTDNFLSWCSPGIPYPPDQFRFLTQGFTGIAKDPDPQKDSNGNPIPLTDAQRQQLRATDTGQLYMQAENLARIVDFVPDINAGINGRSKATGIAPLSIMQNEGTLSDVYEYALKFSQVANSSLSDDEKAELARYRALLQVESTKTDLITGKQTTVLVESPLVVAYHTYMSAYVKAVLDYNSHRVDALTADNPAAVNFWALNANALRDLVKAAMDDWVTNGYKDDYEEIAARIDQIMSKDLSLLKAEYKDDLDKAKLTGIASGEDFYYTSLVPGDFVDGGWTQFTFYASDFASYVHSNSTSYGASASASFLGFGASGGFQHSNGSTQRSFNASSFKLSFEMAQVPIVKAWFKTPFLTSKAWRLDPGNPQVKSEGEILCDGNVPPKGILPGYPTSVIFIRNLSMDFGEANSQFQSDFDSNSAHGSAGWGPFSVSANYSHADSNMSFQSHADGQGIHVDGMQIIGFNCHVLPKTPNPLPDITSWI
jgi:hypothetical protein